MKKYIFALFLCAFATTGAFSQGAQTDQSVVLCESYDEFGTATGTYASWNIVPTGGYVYIVYKQIYAITSSNMQLYVDKKSTYGEDYLANNTVKLNPETGKNWVMYDYFFTEAGKYKFTIMIDGKVAATTYTEIFVVPEDSEEFANGDTTINTFYYEDSYVTFCESVSEGKMIAEAESFMLGENGSVTVTIYISCDNPFKTDLFYIDVFEDVGDDFIDVDSYNITVEPDWDYAFVKQTFNRKGTFVVDIYTADDIYVNTGEVVIY